ncbi:hypothetical protein FIBSPDRAFT_722752 [Athelia psychrophila]|uniref:Copper acquisition factor BIM1-like domain-containing protein n=1 Tax=Athelia psychrophila TaxID=1759441 RepID=A0A167V1U3_9AGAM|nr:hypothetical protein FIBSPDRAFT_915068 [Fibularhizoctonia sp. CBS 109695]KZP32305.1 hypothetical protein FIBSPDRAFT_722752 [Fibularhizoctonia sp. CBS 109695]
MRFASATSAATLAGLVSVVSAHFQLQYPLPRGVFVEDDEPTFCDGYTQAVSNRTVFPLSNGVISMNSEHPAWTVGVIISTAQNPTSFNDFNNSAPAVPFFQTTGEGIACFEIDLLKSGISGLVDGANITIEVVFDGGDGQLYQCADLTLSSNISTPSNATSACKMNITSQEGNTTSTSTAPASASSTAASTGAALRDATFVPGVLAGLVLLAGAALAI